MQVWWSRGRFMTDEEVPKRAGTVVEVKRTMSILC